MLAIQTLLQKSMESAYRIIPQRHLGIETITFTFLSLLCTVDYFSPQLTIRV